MSRPMKNSGVDWLGDIPADWKLTRIKHLCNNEKNSFQDGDWIESPFITEEGIRYLTTGNVGDGIFKRQGNGHISEDTFAELNCKYAYPNDLVISRLNAPYGRACILPSDENKYVLAVDIVILRTDHDKRYLCYLMQCQGYQNSVQDAAKGTTMKRISRTNLGNIYLPIPPLDEQQRIAAFLDDKCARIDSIVEKTRVSVEEYKKLKQAVITRAVTKGIRANRPMKDSGIEWLGDIPADWEIIKMKYLFSIIGGNGFPEILQGNATGDYPFCKVSDINGESDYVDTASNWVSQSVVDSNRFNVIPTDSIIMAKIGAALTKNHRKINTVRCCIDNNTQALVPRRDDDIRYLLYLSKCIDMSWFDNNSTVPSINNSKLLNLFVIAPPLDEQKEIVQYLDEKTAAIDSLVAKKNRLVTELERLKKSLIFEYVTGKKEVPA